MSASKGASLPKNMPTLRDARQFAKFVLSRQTKNGFQIFNCPDCRNAIPAEAHALDCGLSRFMNITDEALERDEKRVAALEEALKKYGHHTHSGSEGVVGPICERLKHSDYACTCGFDDALTAKHNATQEDKSSDL